MNISESHRGIIVEATKHVPSAWQTRFAEAVVDALFGQPDLTDEDIRKNMQASRCSHGDGRQVMSMLYCQCALALLGLALLGYGVVTFAALAAFMGWWL